MRFLWKTSIIFWRSSISCRAFHGTETLCVRKMPRNSFSRNRRDASLSTEAARIVEFLAKGDASVDDISAATGISASEVMSTLIGLELLRKVRKEGGVYHRLR